MLVVNADDAGVDEARNRGILVSARCGIVRSASLLVGFPGAGSFAREAANLPGLGVGLHLNLTEGTPLVAGHQTLVGADGRFLGKHEALCRALAGALDEKEAQREIEAQWNLAVKLLGRSPTHLDGHNHAHLFPGVARALAQCLPERLWVRQVKPTPRDQSPESGTQASEDPYSDPASLRSILKDLSQRAVVNGWNKFRATNGFAGLELVAGHDLQQLLDCIAALALAGGVVELMTHPGYCDAQSIAFSRLPARELELAALCEPRVLARIKSLGLSLCNFGEIS